MFIHSYLTSGFYDMAVLFLESYRKHHGNQTKIILSTRDLTPPQMVILQSVYGKNLEIDNHPIVMSRWAKRCEISVKKLTKFRHQTETHYVTGRNRVWKLLTAGDDRIRQLYHQMQRNVASHDIVIHFDIDTYFKDHIWQLINVADSCDAAMKFRLKLKVVKARITIDCMTFKLNNRVFKFFDTWLKYIDRIPPGKRPIGYGQASCFFAYEQHENNLKWDTVPRKFGLPGHPQAGDVIWTGNIHKMTKEDFLKMAQGDFSNER